MRVAEAGGSEAPRRYRLERSGAANAVTPPAASTASSTVMPCRYGIETGWRTAPVTRTRERYSWLRSSVRMTATCGSRTYAPSFFWRSEEHTSELQSLMRISYAVFCLKKKTLMQAIYQQARTQRV